MKHQSNHPRKWAARLPQIATACVLAVAMIATTRSAHAQSAPATQPSKTREQLEADLSKLLSGANLVGSFNSTGPGADPAKLKSDKYELGEVRRLEGTMWLIQAKMPIGGKQVLLPLRLPIEWAGDTPVIVVENFTIPGMGTYSARVMFFAGHYSGYWKHGEHGGNMFGIVKRAEPATTTSPSQ